MGKKEHELSLGTCFLRILLPIFCQQSESCCILMGASRRDPDAVFFDDEQVTFPLDGVNAHFTPPSIVSAT